jgi:hypothetical protein
MYGNLAMKAGVVGQHDRNARISAMFWECVTNSRVGILVPISGNMNSEKYIESMASHRETLWKISIYFPG